MSSTWKYLEGNLYSEFNSVFNFKISFFDNSLKKIKLPKIIKFNKKYIDNVDIIFTALPNGEAQILSNHLNKKNVLIDLAADFRLKKRFRLF